MKTRPILTATGGTLALAILLACGSGDPKSTPAGDTPPATTAVAKGVSTVAAGAAVNITTASGDQLTVTVAEPTANVPSGNQFITPQKGQFLTVRATVEFKSGRATFFANPLDFKIVAADGTVHESQAVSFIEPAFPSTQLNTGQKATGKVAFDIPAAIKPGTGAKIQFNGSWDGKAAAFWTL